MTRSRETKVRGVANTKRVVCHGVFGRNSQNLYIFHVYVLIASVYIDFAGHDMNNIGPVSDRYTYVILIHLLNLVGDH